MHARAPHQPPIKKNNKKRCARSMCIIRRMGITNADGKRQFQPTIEKQKQNKTKHTRGQTQTQTQTKTQTQTQTNFFFTCYERPHLEGGGKL